MGATTSVCHIALRALERGQRIRALDKKSGDIAVIYKEFKKKGGRRRDGLFYRKKYIYIFISPLHN